MGKTNRVQIRKISLQNIKDESDMSIKIMKAQYFAYQCRLCVLEILYKRGNGHWGGSASVAELLVSLYGHMMNVYPKDPRSEERDRLVLSKGHAVPILYVILAEAGFFPRDELSTFRELNSRLQGHPSMRNTPGIDASTGPLGHGISIGLGMALAARLLGKKFWTFVILGEGCLNEGQSWEAIMSTAKFAPSRFVIMIDYNKVQLDGPSSDIMPLDPLVDKFSAFNLNVSDKIYDGHSISDIIKSWEWAQKHHDKPCVLIYRTHKGKGISFMEDTHIWHGKTIDHESYLSGKAELLQTLENLKHELS